MVMDFYLCQTLEVLNIGHKLSLVSKMVLMTHSMSMVVSPGSGVIVDIIDLQGMTLLLFSDLRGILRTCSDLDVVGEQQVLVGIWTMKRTVPNIIIPI